MSIRIVRLGSPRAADEGIRIGSVRHPPRGVPKSEHASRDFYDAWLPQLSPSRELLAQAKVAEDEVSWRQFEKAFVKEMNAPDNGRLLDLLAAMSSSSNFSLGCYCENEDRCHRSVLRQLLLQRGAIVES